MEKLLFSMGSSSSIASTASRSRQNHQPAGMTWLTHSQTHGTQTPAHTPLLASRSTRNSLNQIQNTGKFERPFQDKPNKTQDSNTARPQTPNDFCGSDDALYRPEKSEDSGNTFLSFLALMATSAMRCI